MKEIYADLHIHIGWTEDKLPVKISSSKNLTFINILTESFYRKGLDMIGIVDAHSPRVQAEIINYIKNGIITELPNGGLAYRGLTIILGSEIAIKEPGRGEAHFLVYFPALEDMVSFSRWLQQNMKNINLSSQRLYVPTLQLQKEVNRRGGMFIPAHIFTPYKSVYGNCCNKMEEVMDLSLIDAVELGLSSDTNMADRINELHNFSFLSNSDAHSLQKIGREYNKLLLLEPSFQELKWSLHKQNGRKIIENYGLDPKLGKYYKSRCANCDLIVEDAGICHHCGSSKIIKGVSNRIEEIADFVVEKHPDGRPPYKHQIPLEFIPKLGPKTLTKLLIHFGTEMNILHRATKQELLRVITDDIAEMIIKARNGQLQISHGGGGAYGKILD